jgi:hypothetical protein
LNNYDEVEQDQELNAELDMDMKRVFLVVIKAAGFATVCILTVWLTMLCLMGCVQHELVYTYYLKDPNSVHVEKLHYKQNVFAMKTDKIMTEAAFADVIKLKMDRSVQIPDPNTIKAIGGAVGEGGGVFVEKVIAHKNSK